MDQHNEAEKPLPPDQEKTFKIISPREVDSLGTTEWRKYLDKDKLTAAWAPPDGSPYLRFQKFKTINFIDQLVIASEDAERESLIRPRYSQEERNSEEGLENLISRDLGHNTAVILDSGGAHSVAMAAKLAKLGYQPVVMLDGVPHPNGSVRVEQSLATMLYFAAELERLKELGKFRANSPPVFILDTHRHNTPTDSSRVDNTYSYGEADFPSADELDHQGIRQVIYLNEGDQNGQINKSYQSSNRLHNDLKAVATKWEQAGITILYTGITP